MGGKGGQGHEGGAPRSTDKGRLRRCHNKTERGKDDARRRISDFF